MSNSTKQIRENIAKHPFASVETLLKLAEDENADIRKALIQRTNITQIVLEKIFETTIQHIPEKIKMYKTGLANQLLSEIDIFLLIAKNTNTPNSLLKQLAFNLREKTEGLSNAVFDRIQQLVAENKNSSISTLEKLTKLTTSGFCDVQKAARKNLKSRCDRPT
ncbi:MAG: hypothetical protein ACRC2R_18720 [Xenococcaceae cyanobacterium]